MSDKEDTLMQNQAEQGTLHKAVSKPRKTGKQEKPVSMDWKPGDLILDIYKVKKELGVGGFGKVFQVHHKAWNIDLAVKMPKPEAFTDKLAIENFVREAQTWIDLGLYPHIVCCYYVRVLSGAPCVFVEYVEGGSLSDWIKQKKLYEGGKEKALERILDFSVQFAWGLHYAHETGLVHQDIKPANVMIAEDSTIKVTDFGLARARALAGEKAETKNGQSILVSSGGMTPAYCSPEQAKRQNISRKTDIWSFGVSLLEMFTGGVTWMSGVAAPQVLESVINRQTKEKNIPALPEGLAALLSQCFEIDDGKRPASMGQVVEDLSGIYKGIFGCEYTRVKPDPIDVRADSLNNKAVSYYDLGLEQEAQKCWEDALKIDPKHLESVVNLDYYRWQKAEITGSELVDKLTKMETELGNNPDYGNYLGWIYLEQGNIEKIKEIQGQGKKIDDKILLEILASGKHPVGREVRQLGRYTYRVSAVSISPDGRFVLSANNSGTIYLWEMATGKELRRFEEYAGKIKSVCISPDCLYALVGVDNSSYRNKDCTLSLWDITAGKKVRRFEGHKGSVNSVRFSPDGSYALSGGMDTTLRLWDVRTGRQIRSFKRNKGSISSVCFSPNSYYVVAGSYDKTIRLWQTANGREVRRFAGHKGIVSSVCFSSDGRFLLSGSWDKTVRLWEVDSGKEVRCFEGHKSYIKTVCFSPDGLYVISGDIGNNLRVWETASGKELRCFTEHKGSITSVYFLPDNRSAISGSEDGSLRLWKINYTKNKLPSYIHPFLCHIKKVSLMHTDSDKFKKLIFEAENTAQKRLYSKAYYILREAQSIPGYERDDKILSLLNICAIRGHGKRSGIHDSWASTKIFKGHTGDVKSVCFSSDSRYALSGSKDKTICLWDTASGKQAGCFKGHKDEVQSVCISPDSRYVLSGSSDKSVRLWEIENCREVRRFKGHTGAVKSVCFSPDGCYALSGGMGIPIYLYLWDVSKGKQVRRFGELNGIVFSVCFSPDGRYALSGSAHEPMYLWDVATGKRLHQFQGHTFVISVCFSPDGRYILSSNYDDTICLWDVASGKEIRQFEHRVAANSVCFTPDGLFALSSISEDKIMRLWDVSSGKEIQRLVWNTGSPVSFSSDGRYALSGSQDNTIQLWEIDWEWEFPEEKEKKIN